MTDQDIKNMITINFRAGGNNGCTSGVASKGSWTVNRVNNRIRVDYNVVGDTLLDKFQADKAGSATLPFDITGVNFI